jgi:DNA-binding response OmpR family regulator
MPDPDFPPSPCGRILVADDEPHIRRILVTLLEAHGFQVDQAEDGAEALQQLVGDTDYQAALLDIMMPAYTGLEILREVRPLPHRKDLPIVILTAKGQDADRKAAFRLGASDFVTKPFSPKKLIVRIDQLLGPS